MNKLTDSICDGELTIVVRCGACRTACDEIVVGRYPMTQDVIHNVLYKAGWGLSKELGWVCKSHPGIHDVTIIDDKQIVGYDQFGNSLRM